MSADNTRSGSPTRPGVLWDWFVRYRATRHDETFERYSSVAMYDGDDMRRSHTKTPDWLRRRDPHQTIVQVSIHGSLSRPDRERTIEMAPTDTH